MKHTSQKSDRFQQRIKTLLLIADLVLKIIRIARYIRPVISILMNWLDAGPQ